MGATPPNPLVWLGVCLGVTGVMVGMLFQVNLPLKL